MREPSLSSRLKTKTVKHEELAEEVIKNKELLHELLNGVSSANPRIKFGSAKVLRIISERNPKTLYPSMEFFVNLLDSENNILKWNAIDIIANLTAVDSRNKFNKLFKKFYGYLNSGSLITAAHVVDNSGKIALTKPELQNEITKELLKTEKIPMPTEECRNILIGKTMKTFEIYYDKIKEKDEIVLFVKRQLNNSRKATKAKAEKLLKNWKNIKQK